MKMASALPNMESKKNGLFDLHKQLVERPTQPLVCVVILDSNQTLYDHDKHGRTPTVRIMHIEPLTDRSERDAALLLLQDAYRERTTEQMELPLGLDAPRRPTAGEWPYEKDEN